MVFLKRVAVAPIIIAMFFMSCKSPTNNIKVVVDANVIKYSAMIYVTDAADGATIPAGLTLTVSGANAGQVYELSGKKSFTFADGIIAIGPGPTLVPTMANPVEFMITIAAPGYKSITRQLQINAGEVQQVISISLAKTTSEEPGGATVTTTPPNLNTAGTSAVTLDFTGTCQNKSNFEFKPSNYIFYRISGTSAAYQYLGYMNKGIITTPLVLDTTYDFKFVYNGQSYVVTQKVDATNYSETVDMGTTLCDTF
jgi:hypothetical protein